jgi:hypothetical protein
MADVVLPPGFRVSAVNHRIVGNAASFVSPLTGATRTYSRPGDRWGVQVSVDSASDRESFAQRALYQAVVGALRSKANRLIFSDPSYVRRGSFPSTEILSNPDFSGGVTGWSSDSRYTASESGRVLRATVNASAGSAAYPAFQNPTYVQYAPYAMRALVRAGRGTWAPQVYAAGAANVTIPGGTGYGVAAAVANATSGLSSGVYDNSTTGLIQGDFLELHYASASRCALVDNSPNLLLQSNAFGTSPWTLNNATSGANGTAGPDGSIASQALVENVTNAAHNAQQTVTIASSVADIAISCDIKAGTRGWGYLQLFEATGSTIVTGYFNVSAGTVGNVYAGANWSNGRLFIVPRGNGWHRCTMVVRKTNAATSITGYVGSATGDNAATYAGVASATALELFGASMALSSVPVAYRATTAAASTGALQTGFGLFLKGLPVSTNGLLLAGDQVEITTPNGPQFNIATGALNSDAAGLGWLPLAMAARSPADNVAAIVHQPMGRFVLDADEVGWSSRPGRFSDFSLDLIEAFS